MGTYASQDNDFDYAFSFATSTGEHEWTFSLTYDSTDETYWSSPSVLQNISGSSGISHAVAYKNGSLLLGDPQNERVEVYESYINSAGFFTSGFYKVNRCSAYGVDEASGFGYSVVAVPNGAVVGAPYTSVGTSASGAGAIFGFNEVVTGGHGATGTASWGQYAYVTGSVVSGCFGCSLAKRFVSSTPIVSVAATGELGGTGKAYLYNGATLTFLNTVIPTGHNITRFGRSQAFSVANDIGYLAIGLSDGGTGKVNIYKESSAGANDYAFYQQLSAGTPANGDLYGAAMHGLDQALMVGAPAEAGGGKAYYYEFNSESGIFAESQAFRAASVSDDENFGKSVSFSTDYAVIGADSNSGSAYIYKREGDEWVEESQITGSLTTISGSFAGNSDGANSIIIDTKRIIIGTEGEKDTYVFTTGIADRDDYVGVMFSGANNKLYDSDGNFLYGFGPNTSCTVSGGVFTGGYFSMFVNGNLCRARSPREAGVGRTGALNDWAVTNMSGMAYYNLSILN